LNNNPTEIIFQPAADRVLNRPCVPKDAGRISYIIDRVLSFDEAEAKSLLATLHTEFEDRHRDLKGLWLQQFDSVKPYLSNEESLSESRRLLIGAIFTSEYAIESAAFCNPSIVPHPDQTNLDDKDLRFILTLRAIGEGHISSIEFRSGVIRGNHSIEVDKTSAHASEPDLYHNPTFAKSIFLRKLSERGLYNAWSRLVLDPLGTTFTKCQLDQSVQSAAQNCNLRTEDVRDAMHYVRLLVESNYDITFSDSVQLSERVIFPVSLDEKNGMEDARFVRFTNDDQSVTYYASYTAYDGCAFFPKLIQTNDFLHFRIRTLNGPVVKNKGMALFPRPIDGHYAMLSRYDDENLHLLFSDDLYFWSDPQLLLRPVQPWESVKIGNCGSPIEIDAGWLVLTHGVGPMRKYCISAVLLDLQDPLRVIGRLNEPLIVPPTGQRDGYVPNVVYSCGALVHNGRLILPHGINDTTTTIVTIDLETLLAALN
jgi:predicted GH43/DUF377 family glycosyl hydrolase